MHTRILTLIALLSAPSLPAATPLRTPGAAIPIAEIVAFTNVSVIPMTGERLLAGQTVIVEGNRIREVGPTDAVAIPAGAQRIDAPGRYLMPGLADLHTHPVVVHDLLPYLAGGVTTILSMGGAEQLLQWRERVDSGELLGPQILLGRFIDGSGGRGGRVGTAAEARTVVQQAAATGYEYMKVYNSLTTEQFDAIISEAEQQGLTVIGHGVRDPGMEHILRAGMRLVAHGEEYIYTFFNNQIDDDRIAAAAALTLEAGAYVLPNLSAYEIIHVQWGKPAQVDRFLQQPEARYLHPNVRRIWLQRRYAQRRGSIEDRLLFLRRMTLAFHEAGVPIVAGTDSPGIPGMFAGSSIHDELRNLVLAGLSPLEALRAATRVAGEFVQQTTTGRQPFGQIAPGYRADLLLLRENPLDRVSNARQIEGVMVAGRWLPRVDLTQRLEEMARDW